jgi:serine/threonine-protein kinase RsbW
MPRDGWHWTSDEVIPSDPAEGKRVLDELLDALRELNWIQHDVFGVHLAVEEALVNAIKHGNRHDPGKNVRFACRVSDERVQVEIADEGPGFNPRAVPDCTMDENLEVPSGRGLMLMRSFMSRVEYNDKGNCVVMEKVRGKSGCCE